MLALLLLLIACADPAKDKSAARVAEPAPREAPAAPAPVGTEVAARGTIGFVGAKVTDSHEGRFPEWTGAFLVEGDTLRAVNFEVKTAAVEVEPERLRKHLVSEDFFDAANHPTATFTSTRVSEGAPADSKLAGATHTVEGDLTLRGTTRRLSFPAIIGVTPSMVSASTEFSINRKDFKIEYPGKPDDLIRDDVLLKVSLTGTRGSAPAADAGNPPSPH